MMSHPKFQILRSQDLDLELANLLGRWDGTPEQHLSFITWAMETAKAAERSALEDAELTAENLRSERDFAHRLIAEQACRAAVIDLELVSRRMFFDWLRVELQPRRLAA